jgi:Sigma-70, region 4
MTPAEQEATLIALWTEGLELTEIAQRLGIPRGTVSSRATALRKRGVALAKRPQGGAYPSQRAKARMLPEGTPAPPPAPPPADSALPTRDPPAIPMRMRSTPSRCRSNRPPAVPGRRRSNGRSRRTRASRTGPSASIRVLRHPRRAEISAGWPGNARLQVPISFQGLLLATFPAKPRGPVHYVLQDFSPVAATGEPYWNSSTRRGAKSGLVSTSG